MSTPTTVTIDGLNAVSSRRNDRSTLTIMDGSTQFGTATVLDPFGYDIEFQAASPDQWEDYRERFKRTPHLVRSLRVIANAPEAMMTPTGFLVMPDATIGQLLDTADLATLCLHVNTGSNDDAHEAVQKLVTALAAAPLTRKDREQGAIDPRAAYDPAGVLDGSTPKTLTYPAKIDGVRTLVSVDL